jgi:hypothetical protein
MPLSSIFALLGVLLGVVITHFLGRSRDARKQAEEARDRAFMVFPNRGSELRIPSFAETPPTPRRTSA